MRKVQGQKGDERREGSGNEREGRSCPSGNDGVLPRLRNKNVQDYGEEIDFKDYLTDKTAQKAVLC